MVKLYSVLMITTGLLVSSLYAMENTYKCQNGESLPFSFETIFSLNTLADTLGKATQNNLELPNILMYGPAQCGQEMLKATKELAQKSGFEHCYFSPSASLGEIAEELMNIFKPTGSARKKMIVVQEQTENSLFGERCNLSLRDSIIQNQLLSYTQTPSSDYLIVFISATKPQKMSKSVLSRCCERLHCTPSPQQSFSELVVSGKIDPVKPSGPYFTDLLVRTNTLNSDTIFIDDQQ